MNKRWLAAGIAALILCAGAVLIIVRQQKWSEKIESETIKEPEYELFVLCPVTGDLAYIGEYAKWAVTYAGNQINESGGIDGIPVKITVLDTQFQTDQAKKMKKDLVKDQRIFIGPSDVPGTSTEVELIVAEQIPNIAAYSFESLRKIAAPYGISYMSDTTEGEVEAVKLWKQLNPDIEKVAVFASSSEESQMESAQMLKEFLPELGIKQIEIIAIDDENQGIMKAVVKALNKDNEGYISLVRAEVYGSLITELRKRGVDEGRRITASFAGFETSVLDVSPEVLDGSYIWNKFDVSYDGEDWERLLTEYKREHDGSMPDSNVVPDMYNAVMAWKQCMEELNLNWEVQDLMAERRQIAEWFYHSPVLQGIQGDFQWVEGKKVSPVYYFQFTEEGMKSVR